MLTEVFRYTGVQNEKRMMALNTRTLDLHAMMVRMSAHTVAGQTGLALSGLRLRRRCSSAVLPGVDARGR